MAQHKVLFNRLNELEQEIEGNINKALILNNLQLKDSQFPESEIERKSLEISVGTDGNANVASFKLYNILHLNQSKFRISILGIISSTGGIIVGSGTPATVFGVLGLIGTFMGASEKTFDQQEANVLLAIYRLGINCHIGTIPTEYKTSFGKEISEQQLQASLDVLVKFKTIEIREEEVFIIESVNINH